MEERSKVMAGSRYENNRRELDKSLKNKQYALKAKHRQGTHVGVAIIPYYMTACM